MNLRTVFEKPVRDGTGSACKVVKLLARCLAFLLFLFVVRFGFLLLFLFFLLLRAKYPPEAASLGSLRSPRSACQDMGVLFRPFETNLYFFAMEFG